MPKIITHSKQVVHKSHHPHLKRRLALEVIGFLVLLPLIWRERETVTAALQALRSSDLLYFGIAIAIYWLMQPISSYALRIICGKNISITNATLTRIAGSGPGRIIPGGLGAVSLDVLHLKKSKATIVHKHAISIVATQQILAVITNILLVILILFFHEPLRSYINSVFPTSVSIITVMAMIFGASLVLWLHHIRVVRRRIIPVERYVKKLLTGLLTNPRRLVEVIILSLSIIFLNGALLLLSSLSLGTSMSIWDGVIAISSGVLIGGIVPTPGGIGIVEAGITASLIALGYDASHAAGVAILFRVITYWLPLIPGTISYLYLVENKII